MVSQELLDSIPVSKYAAHPSTNPSINPSTSQFTTHKPGDTKENSSSDETVDYWPLNEKSQQTLLQGIKLHQPCATATSTTVKKKDRTFHLSTHGIQWQKPKYYFKCNTSGCTRTFNCIKDWNLYHRLKHKTLINCSICNRKFTMLSAHHAHK